MEERNKWNVQTENDTCTWAIQSGISLNGACAIVKAADMREEPKFIMMRYTWVHKYDE